MKFSFRWVWGLLFLAIAAVLVLRNADSSDSQRKNLGADDSDRLNQSPASGGSPDSLEVARNKRPGARAPLSRKEGVSPVFLMVDAIVTDQSISEAEAAKRLRDIAQRTDVSEAERAEALSHGLTLDFEAFGGFGRDSTLPVPLARKFLDELTNLGSSEVFRASSLLDFLTHSDPEIRTQAAEQLADVLDQESLSGDFTALRREAWHYLEARKAQSAIPAKDGAP